VELRSIHEFTALFNEYYVPIKKKKRTEEDLDKNRDLVYLKLPCGHMSGTTLENCEKTQSK
jgi:hypothetical protein